MKQIFFLKTAELRNKMAFAPQVQARSPSGMVARFEVADGPSATIREAAVPSSIPVPTVQFSFVPTVGQAMTKSCIPFTCIHST